MVDKTTDMPRDIWAEKTIHGEPYDWFSVFNKQCVKYTNTAQLIERLEGMKVDATCGFDRSVIEYRERHNQSIQDIINIIGCGDE